MIEFRDPKSIESYSDEHEVAEQSDDMPEVTPGLLCLMDYDYTSRKAVPGQSVTLRKGTPVIIKTIDKASKTVTAMDANRNIWTFTEEECFEDVDFWFCPVTKKEYDFLLNPTRLHKARKWNQLANLDGTKTLSLMGILLCGGIGVCVKDYIPDWAMLFFVIGMCAGMLCLITAAMLEWIACYHVVDDVYMQFLKQYDVNMRELKTLMNECPVFAEEEAK